MNHKSRLKQIAEGAKDAALETLWPTRCCVCDKPGALLCQQCEQRLMLIDSCLACPKCGAPYGMFECTECNDHTKSNNPIPQDVLSECAHVAIANDVVQRMIATYKDRDERRLVPIIANYLTRYVAPSWLNNAIITYIPDSIRAYTRRGFDHMEPIAKELARINNLECVNIFARPKSSDQRKLSRSERAKNTSDTFRIINDRALEKDIILIDDISTTGATLLSAANCIAIKRQHLGLKTKSFGLTFGKVLE